MNRFLTLCCLLLAAPLAAIEVYEFDTPEQEALYQKITKELRCVMCQNQNLADSPAGLATDLKKQIAEFVRAGQDEATIKQYMIDRYGDFINYNPPLNARTVFLWFSPLVVFLIGGLVLYVNIKKSRRSEDSNGESNVASNEEPSHE
ncbi:cytochrome c-type biogenesis protein [Marinicella meishanensis]|uniref:cytochrome c-type biogenesis protein n=1 Tax=Marinicella meishanensis TaxID=2873263 RepID=UPI001CBD27BA|nr:cytochrome c-type biogenesis protein [Marinicella sp. NBU2979]